ncbi:hypothetical protein [Flavilitoribacter nigricans]|uniref:DUF1320 domain-containing protein n=1 Tax=Flavilitoribacter nigricans (strain ATCC 23147 / DSM 23189 / NBRC 102662 / NCIMB 1420 / SS-2) TaxID=1122177 RepID=A0A2D0MWM5_FLAN2|nr:hypothetical protein [Flavilitoribacter nigricans]PHN00607.1 hypothetical protein CRP01_41375 [Flavilitoribacter nigricans DSM 23189 = NBRC 102662]
MYRFICTYDYLTIIREAIKSSVTDDTDNRRLVAEQFARDEMEGYLNLEYDVDRILNFRVFDADDAGVHKVGDLVINNSTDKQYVCIQDGATGSDADLADTNKFVEDKLEVIKTYAAETAYAVGDTVVGPDKVRYLVIKSIPTEGKLLSDTEYFWTKRNALMVMLYVDISAYHYHARISANQVPQLRIDRYLDAIDKLKRIRRKELTPAIPRADLNADGEPDSGSIVMWSNEKRDNNW